MRPIDDLSTMPDDTTVDMNTVPWQYRFAVLFGVPALVCVYLVWWLTSSLDVQLRVILTNQATILAGQQAVAGEGVTYRHELENQTRILEAIRYSQYQICVNGLGPGRDTRACLGGGRQFGQED